MACLKQKFSTMLQMLHKMKTPTHSRFSTLLQDQKLEIWGWFGFFLHMQVYLSLHLTNMKTGQSATLTQHYHQFQCYFLFPFLAILNSTYHTPVSCNFVINFKKLQLQNYLLLYFQHTTQSWTKITEGITNMLEQLKALLSFYLWQASILFCSEIL